MVVRLIAAWWCGLVAALVAVLLVPASPVGAVAGFGDVDGGRYFADAVQWSVDNGITGVDGSCFSPDQPVTRGETAVWIWRMQDRPEAPAHSFVDVTVVEQQQSVAWMVSEGVTTGTSDTTFSPDRELTRVEVAAFLWRLAERPDAAAHPFVDVLSGWQQGPVSWMASTGITTGTSDSTFSPDGTLTRAQLITFLYRYNDSPTVTIDPDAPTCPPTEQEPEVVAPVDAGSGPYGDLVATDRYGRAQPHAHADSITRLKDLGVFDGTECAQGYFCPDDPVDHATFSVWLTRVLDGDDDSDAVGVCAAEPAGSCLESPVSRSDMAVVFAKAFDLEPAKNPARFVDVDSDSSTYDNITRLRATTIDTDCGRAWRFCPDDAVTRSQMANLLARAIDWQKARAEVAVSGSDNSIGLVVTYDEEEYEATVSWSVPSADKGPVDHYVLQSRIVLEDFGPIFYQIIESESGKTSYQVNPSNSPNHNHLYAFRVITVYADGKRLATNEVKTPSQVRRLRDIIWEKIVAPNQEEQPWLTDTWIHMNDSARFGLAFGAGAVDSSSEYPYLNGLKRTFARSLTIGSIILESQSTHYSATLIAEMGHVYTLTNQVDKNSAPIGVGHLYIHLLEVNHKVEAKRPTRCSSSELYGDLAKLVFWDRYSEFDAHLGLRNSRLDGVTMQEWSSCGFRLDPSTKQKVEEYIPAIARSVFIDQEVPQWFYDTYQKSDGTIDLDKLWSDITIDERYKSTMGLIAHHLRNEFGGYCSEEQVRQFIEGKVTGITNPWKDGGCDDNVVVEGEESRDNDSNPNPEDANSGPNGNNIDDESINVNYSKRFIRTFRSRPSRCWIALNGYAYNVTPEEGGYVYPGPGNITDLCGQDVSAHFAENNIDPPPQRHIVGSVRD